MRLPNNFIQEVVERTDIEELIGRYVTLKRAGANNLIGLCPFHSEKTPSFTVAPAKRMFYCFGCHAGGDAVTFVRLAENLSYLDAVEYLANRAGIPMPRGLDEKPGEQTVTRRRVLDMNLDAAKFFRACLFDPTLGEPGMAYLRGKRRLSDATIKHFGLGYAPADFGMLTDHMHRLGYTDEELQVGFLCGKNRKTGRSYDYFRGRVMFPIIDTLGNVVAFGGRVLDDSKPKYLNTSDTPAFRKSNHLFALNFAKNDCAERMILCEGYMDVIALHAAGFSAAVATLGTAITPNHARIFSKYTKQVVITYDSDEAGQNAANKAMRVLGEVGMDVRVLRLDGAKDPDEYIVKFGAEKFRRALDGSRTGFDYKTENILAKYDLSVPSDRIRASGELCELIAGYPSAVERAVYVDQIAKVLNLAPEILQNTIDKTRQKQLTKLRETQGREAQNTVKRFGDRVDPEAAKDPRAAAAEESLLGLLLLFSEYREEIAQGRAPLTEADFATDFDRRVFCAIMRGHESESGFRFELLGETFTPEEMGRIRKMEVMRQNLSQNGPSAFRSAVDLLRQLRQERDLKQSGRLDDYLQMKRNKLRKGKVDAHEKENGR